MKQEKVSRKEFAKYAAMCSELYTLEKQIKRFAQKDKGKQGYCAHDDWYRYCKPVVVKFVGWSAIDERLRTCEAYDVVYEYLYMLLPDCEHEMGMCCFTGFQSSLERFHDGHEI